MRIGMETPTILTLDNLLKIKQQNHQEFVKKARELAQIAMDQKKIYTVFRIAKELQELYCDVEEMENFIIASKDPYYILKFAREIRNANVIKLEQAIINSNQIDYIARFGCYVSGANTDLIENIILESNNARAAYIYISFGKYPNWQKLKHILIKSKKPRYLYTLAKFSNDPQEINLIQDLIIASHSHMYVRLFAAHIPYADIRKLEERILKSNDFEEMKKFAKAVCSERINKIIMLM